MGLGRRHARQHETAGFQKNALDSTVFWEYKPQQQVMTVDGFSGIVTAVYDGPYPGTEEYEVTLDSGLGGGFYTASQLSPLAGTTASHDHEATGLHLASDDYEELHDILHDRPPIERMTFSAARGDTPFDFQHEEVDTGGTKFPRRVDMTAHHPETGEEAGRARYYPPKRKGGPISIDEVKGHVPGAASALLNEIEERHPGSSTKFLWEVKRNNNNPDVTGHAHEHAGQPTDWDTHYPNVASTIHRGLALKVPSHSARVVNSSGNTKDEHLAEIHSAMPEGPNVGTHWTEDERRSPRARIWRRASPTCTEVVSSPTATRIPRRTRSRCVEVATSRSPASPGGRTLHIQTRMRAVGCTTPTTSRSTTRPRWKTSRTRARRRQSPRSHRAPTAAPTRCRSPATPAGRSKPSARSAAA
jgi:hypothetical protein